MSVRRGPFKLKLQLPENDEDSESGSECVASHEDTNDSDASSDRSSGGREIDATPNKKISSSGDEGSDVMEKQGERNNKKSRLSSSSSDEESDMEEKRSVQYDNSVSASDSSDDEDSDGEVKQDSQSDSSANYSDNSADEDSVLDEKRSMQNDNSASSSGSSNDEYSDVEMKQQSQHDNSASSSDSSSDEDSSLEEKHSTRNDKDRGDSSSSDSSRSGGSGEDSSASDFDSSQSESEEKPPPGKMKKSPIKVEVKKAVVSKTHAATTSAKRVLKRLRRPGKNNGEDSSNGDISDEDSSDEDSPVALDLPPALKSSDNQEQEDSNTESEREEEEEEEEGSLDSDEDKDWPPRNDKEDEGDSKARRGKDDVVGDSDEEWLEELDEVKPRPRSLVPSQRKGINDLNQARYLMRNITSHVPLIEETAIRRGVKLSGPPLEFATTHQDEFARKFRWPQHFRNLRNRDFSQDPSDILEDHELLSVVRQAESSEERPPKESPLAQVPRPMVSVAAEALRRSLRKRRRRRSSDNEDSSVHAPSAVTLLNTARVGGQFGDRFVESLLSANGKAMQGIIGGDEDYDKRCWSSLPTKRKPIANWRFVLEHLRKTMGRSDHNDVVYPPMKQETLERITKRLKTLYGYTTQHEEYDVFADASPNANNNSVDIEE